MHTVVVNATATLADVRNVRFFDSVPDEAVLQICEHLLVRTFAAREFVISEGDVARGMYVLRSGKARIFRTGVDGREQSLRLLSPGQSFGEVPVFDGGPSPASVETLEPSEVVLFPTTVVNEVVRRYPDVALALLLHVTRRLRFFTELIELVSLQTVPARLARYLLQLAREEGERCDEGIRVPRSITQRDLASLVGSVREVVSRSLKAMEEDGVLVVRRHEIVILDVKGLQALV